MGFCWLLCACNQNAPSQFENYGFNMGCKFFSGSNSRKHKFSTANIVICIQLPYPLDLHTNINQFMMLTRSRNVF